MTEVLEKMARDRADYLKSASERLTGEAVGFLAFAQENCNFVRLLSLIWQVELLRLQKGGASAKLFLNECDLLLTLIAAPEHFLRLIARVWQERRLPEEIAQSIYADVEAARSSLEALSQQLQKLRAAAATPTEVSVDAEQLKQRVRKADEEKEWIPLREMVARMRQESPLEQE